MVAPASQYRLPSQAKVIRVTPEMAGDWFERRNHPENRTTSKRVWTGYADDIRNGLWMLTREGLVFDTEGLIISAQHRLRALNALKGERYVRGPLAGHEIKWLEFWVYPNELRETYAVMDSGYKRTAAHLIGGRQSKSVAAAARHLALLGRGPGLSLSAYSKISNPEIAKWARAWPELDWWSADTAEVKKHAKIPPGPHLAVIAQAASTKYRDRIPAWMATLRTGVPDPELSERDPVLHLRNRFLSQGHLLSGATNRPRLYSMIVKAWNEHAAGNPMTVLRHRLDEPIPPVLGFDPAYRPEYAAPPRGEAA